MKNTYTMKEILAEDRPYERCARCGPENLTDAELLAVILRSGSYGENSLQLARRVLSLGGQQQGIVVLRSLSEAQLLELKGIGQVKATLLRCVLEISRRMAMQSVAPTLAFRNPTAIAAYYMEDLRYLKQETARLLLLNAKEKLLGECDVTRGTVNRTLVSPRELFIEALQRGAVAIILLHNHPSGDPTPSKADILLTKRLCHAGELIGIELLDHIIMGDQKYFSFREEHMM